MRLLSELEQKICDCILTREGPNNLLQNVLDPLLGNVKIEVKDVGEKYEVEICYKERVSDSEDEETHELILTAVNLIQLLEREGYIMLYMVLDKQLSETSFGPGASNQSTVDRLKINDDDVKKLLAEYVWKRIYVTEEFRVFCANGCIPRADVQFNQSLELTRQSLGKARTSNRIAIATLAITFLSFLVSIAASWGWRPSFFS